MESKVELVFIPSPGAGHLVSTLEIAKLLVGRHPRLSITVLILNLPLPSVKNTTAESLTASTMTERITFVDIQHHNMDPSELTMVYLLSSFYQSQRPYVRDAVNKIVSKPGSPRLGGFVLDMFCTAFMDVAQEFGVPSYIFFTSNSAFLDLSFHLQDLHNEGEKDLIKFDKDEPGPDLVVPGFTNPIPQKVLPSIFLDKALSSYFYDIIKRIRNANGILINTFMELEPTMNEALSSSDGVPPVYPVGPIINVSPGQSLARFGAIDRQAEIVTWLDEKPPSTVVFLCFGSMGSFCAEQVREIACALEHSGVGFLWSLRQAPEKGTTVLPSEYDNLEEALPEGFLERTAGIGKVIGWAPQVTVLAHPAVGGFVSHCGWNSILESLWFGVPMATWPLAAEQQINAFEMVRELGLAVEITLDYSITGSEDKKDPIVEAEKIEKGIRRLMEQESDTRKKVKEMSEKSRKAVLPGGSSYTSLSQFINEVFENTA